MLVLEKLEMMLNFYVFGVLFSFENLSVEVWFMKIVESILDILENISLEEINRVEGGMKRVNENICWKIEDFVVNIYKL